MDILQSETPSHSLPLRRLLAANSKMCSSSPPLSPADLLTGAKLADSPILFLVYFHRAVTAELDGLRRAAAEMAEGASGGSGGELVLDFQRRFEFLKLVYKYHSDAEDEVIFFVFDMHIENVVCTYMLEHKSIDDIFDSVSDCLNILVETEEGSSKQFQEIVSNIGTIRTTIYQHMLKEEKQIFPSLMQKLSSEEQASLIWQFLCSAPIMLLNEILPWLTSFLSPDEHKEILHCMEEFIPEQELLKEVVIIWLHSKNPSSSSAHNERGKVGQTPDLLRTSEEMVHASARIYGETSGQTNPEHVLFYGLHKWNDIISKDLKGILKSLLIIRSSKDLSTVDSMVVQLKFFTDVVTFYSTAYHIQERFQGESQIESIQRLMNHKTKSILPEHDFLEKLSKELELFVTGISEYLVLLEAEVLPFIKNFPHKFEKWLLHTSLHILPIGLLKCITTWFSAHLSENECNSILNGLKQEGVVPKKYTSEFLLYEWVRMGYSGKTSIDKCIKALQEMYMSRNSFLAKRVREDCASFSFISYIKHSDFSSYKALQTQSTVKAKGYEYKPSLFDGGTMYITPYHSKSTKHVYTPQKLSILTPLLKLHSENDNASSIFDLERRPVDHIFFFHKALRKYLEDLVTLSADLKENVGSLDGFLKHFQLVRCLYQIHSDSEDEIAFPALEAKGKFANISKSYAIDHVLEVELFNKISLLLEEISGFHASVGGIDMVSHDQKILNQRKLCLELHNMCKSMRKVLCDHVQREETELWPLFRECFSIEEQENIIGRMLGRMNAEILQEMIQWLMASLTLEEQQGLLALWYNATRNTMFHEWLGEWWEEMKVQKIAEVEEESGNVQFWEMERLEALSSYLSEKNRDDQSLVGKDKQDQIPQTNVDEIEKLTSGVINNQSADFSKQPNELDKQTCKESADISPQIDKPTQYGQLSKDLDFKHQRCPPTMSQEELEAAIWKISRDLTLDSQKKSNLIQSLLTSRWIISQQKSHPKVPVLSSKEEIPGQCPSYRDPLKLVLGCNHYKRNCKLVAACCNCLFTCRLCHDEVNNHSMDRKATAKMMCMKCLKIQPIGPTCSTSTCHNISMAKYYCRICKLFDDEREIYHCPYCNLCRVGKGLGIDYFHCMNCNACMSTSLSVHACKEKCLDDNCPICHEYIFTSRSPVKALSCGHFMHSECFQDYTFTHYICPICSKTLGDMQVYFAMLDALLAEEKIPEEYSSQIQRILCNDCEKRGMAPFHWLYHKCSHCGSYNTRLL